MSTQVACPECGFPNDAAERFCLRCDARLPDEVAEPPPTDPGSGARALPVDTPPAQRGRPAEAPGEDPTEGSGAAASPASEQSDFVEAPSGHEALDQAEPPSQRKRSRKDRRRSRKRSRSSQGVPRPSHARPEDFPNSILRRVAAGEQVADAPEEAFRRSKRQQAGVSLALEAGRVYGAGQNECVRIRLQKLRPKPLDVEVHLRVTGVEQEVSVRGVRLAEPAPRTVFFPFRAEKAGRKPFEMLELIVVDEAGDIELFGAKDSLRLDLDVRDEGRPPPERPAWEPVDLDPLDRGKVAESLQTVLAGARSLASPKTLVTSRPPRPTPALLRISVEGDPRRMFLFLADDTVHFGRKKPARAGGGNDLVLRLLPCRSREQDPQNWNQTMAISGTHGGLLLKEDGLYLQDTSRHGMILNGRKMLTEEKCVVPDVFVLMLAGVLRLKGRLYHPSEDACLLDLRTNLPLPKQDDFDAANRGTLDCFHMRRVANQEEDEYLFLYRTAAVGASPVCPLRLSGDGVAPIHARLLRHRGLVLITPARGGESAMTIDGRALGRDDAAPLTPGMDLRLGDTQVEVHEASAGDLITAITAS